MLAVIGAVGQAEREAILERQREGINKAMREDRSKGRVPADDVAWASTDMNEYYYAPRQPI
jgi:DNA invertase Pin-like site-specific DNA recombinase